MTDQQPHQQDPEYLDSLGQINAAWTQLSAHGAMGQPTNTGVANFCVGFALMACLPDKIREQIDLAELSSVRQAACVDYMLFILGVDPNAHVVTAD